MAKNIFISILAVFIVLTSCKKIGSIGEPQPEPGLPPLITPIGFPVSSPVSKTIGTQGGSLMSADGKIELNFPAGALAASTAISIQPVTNFCPGGIGFAYHLTPDNVTFSKPVNLTYHYTADDVNGSHPYFLYIAYQDSTLAWKADMKNRNVDSVGKTVSLGINHFSIWSMGNNLVLNLDPLEAEVYEDETREVRAVLISPGSTLDLAAGIYLPQATHLPDKNVTNWKVNGSLVGTSTNGTISGTGNKATYSAPSTIKSQRTVQVSAEINYPMVFFNNGRVVSSVNKFVLFRDLTLLPSVYEYSLDIHVIDEAVTGWKPGQVYEDKASLDLMIKKTTDNNGDPIVTVLASNFKNEPPTVKPVVQTYTDHLNFSKITYEWLPDATGYTNITGVTLEDFDDSTITLKFVHAGAMNPSFKWHTSLGSSGTTPSLPMGGSDGLPQSIRMKLIHQDQNFHWIKVTAK